MPNWSSFKYVVDYGGIVVIANSTNDLYGKMSKIDNGDLNGFYRTHRSMPIELSNELVKRKQSNEKDRIINGFIDKLNFIYEKRDYARHKRLMQNMPPDLRPTNN